MKTVPSKLNVKATANVDVEHDLNIPDPDPEVAKAILQQSINSEDNEEDDEDSQGDE